MEAKVIKASNLFHLGFGNDTAVFICFPLCTPPLSGMTTKQKFISIHSYSIEYYIIFQPSLVKRIIMYESGFVCRRLG